MLSAMRNLLILFTLCPLVGGCLLSRETVNVPLKPALLSSIEPGTTPATEVVRPLGAPNEVVQLARRSAYRYEFDRGKRTGLILVLINFYNFDARSDRVWVFFGEDDIVTHVAGTFDAEDAEWAMPWSDVHD
jgi:hypothetical protein